MAINNTIQPIFNVGKVGEKPVTYNPNQKAGLLQPTKTAPASGIMPNPTTLSPKAEQGFQMNHALPSTGILTPPVQKTTPPPQQNPVNQIASSTQTTTPVPPVPQVTTPPATPVTTPAPNPYNLPPTTPGNPYVANLAGLGNQGSQQVQQATQDISKLQEDYAKNTANIEGTPGYLSLASGQQGILNRQYAGLLGAKETALQNALQGQGQQIGALNSAAGYAQPQAYAPTNIPFSPTTGQFGSLAGSAATGGGGLAGVGALTQQAQQGSDVQTMESAIQQSSGLINKVKQDIASSGFNPAPSAIGNALSAWINTGLFPNPAYSNVINGLNEIVTTIAPVLGVPGNPTDAKLFMAQQLVPQLMSGKDLSSVLDNLEANARVKINAARTASQSNAVTNPTKAAPAAGTTQNGKSIWDF